MSKGLDNGFIRCYEQAANLLHPILTSEFGDAVADEVKFCQGERSRSTKEESRFAQLRCTLKLRKARCLEICPYDTSADLSTASSLYEYVRNAKEVPGFERAYSCYRLGRMELAKPDAINALKILWRGHCSPVTFDAEIDNSQESQCQVGANICRSARDLFLEAATYAGPATCRLSRRIMRYIALTTGPEKIENHSISEAAILIHRSIGGSSRYAASCCSNRDAEAKHLYSSLDGSEKDVEYLLENVKSRLPPEWNIVAITLCPTGELLCATSLKGTAFCVFPTEDDQSNAFRRQVLKPLDNILEKNRVQLSGLDADAASNYGSKNKHKWWEDRALLNSKLEELLKRTEER